MKKLLSFIVQKIIILSDILIHRRRINNFLNKKNFKIKNIYDIGSNNGEYTLLFNRLYPNSKIFSFEPNLKLIKDFKRKTKKFNNIKIINNAVGNSNKYIDLKIDENSSLTTSLATNNKKSSTYKIKKFLYGKSKGKKNKIKLIKLDTFIANNTIPDLLKIDVEGYEDEVLKGVKQNIKKIKLIMIEFHFDKLYIGYNPNRLHNFLIKNKFTHIKSIKFPVLNWEDRFYLNDN